MPRESVTCLPARGRSVVGRRMPVFEQVDLQVAFPVLPTTDRADVVLPEAVLRRVERHTVDIAERREQLRAAGQHLKRGLLLYGPPGTGKTHTTRYVVQRLAGSSVLVLENVAAVVERTEGVTASYGGPMPGSTATRRRTRSTEARRSPATTAAGPGRRAPRPPAGTGHRPSRARPGG